MKVLQESKKIYDRIEIPEELSQVVEDSIRRMEKQSIRDKQNHSENRNENKGKKDNIHPMEVRKKKSTKKKVWIRTLSAAAALFICFSIGLNSNQAFAMEMSQLPFVGVLARVLTIRSYEESNEETGINVAVEVPGVEADNMAKEETVRENLQPSVAIDVNARIEEIVQKHLAKAEEDFTAYKEAFFATGGTEEEWAGRTMDVKVDYQIKFQDEARVSFVLYLTEAWVASYQEEYYYNLDLAQNRELTLEDILGSEWVDISNASILAQMEQRMEENEDYVYWGSTKDTDDIDMGGFTTVDKNTTFYINEAGNPVVTFPKYEIAPGFMGVQEFEIQK